MQALIVGTLLAVLALAYVLYPLLAGEAPAPVRRTPSGARSPSSEHEAIVALREIEFDRATGKLSDADYADLKARYTERALAAMRAASTTAGDPEDEAEAVVRAYRAQLRSCARCGPRPEPDAAYCSTCGLFLAGACASCGAGVTESGAAYCTSCGHALAA